MSELPEGWVECLLGDVTTIIGGGTPDTKDPANFSFSEGIPWLTPADLSNYTQKYISSGKRFLSKKGFKNSSARLLPKDTVLFSSRAPIGYVVISKNDIATNQGFKSFICNKDVMPDFLYYYLKSAVPLIEQLASGTTFAEISGSRAAQIPFSYPPRPEQRSIVQQLDHLIPKLEACRARLDTIPTTLKRFRQAILSAACSGRLTEDWRFKNPSCTNASDLLCKIAIRLSTKARARRKEPAINETDLADMGIEVPRKWLPCRLDSIFSVETGATPYRKNSSYYAGGTIPWIKTGEVQNCEIYNAEERITQKALDETNTKIFPEMTILIAMYGEGRTRGQVARLRIQASTNQACAALVNDKLDTETNQYVYLFCQSQYDIIRKMAVGGNQPNLNLQMIKEWLILLPPIEEQREIVRRVEVLFKQADAIQARYEKARIMVDRLPQAILAKAFRGELVHEV